MAEIEVRIHGARGSHPVADRGYLAFGGNTACVSVRLGEAVAVFDAGTGIVRAGSHADLAEDDPAIFLTHLHHDHLMGLMFYAPLYKRGRRVTLYVPQWLTDAFWAYWKSPYFPVHLPDVDSILRVEPVASGDVFYHVDGGWCRTALSDPAHGKIEDGKGRLPQIEALALDKDAHPRNGVVSYKAASGGKSVVYATDIELAAAHVRDAVIAFATGADILLCDSHFTAVEYRERFRGWGHSSMEMAAEIAKKAHVKELLLFHHAPFRDDDEMAQLEVAARRLFPHCRAAREGDRFTL